MKHIILIEDRIERQKQYLGKGGVEKLSGIENLTMPQSSECRRHIDTINEGKINHLDDFDLIILHRSPIDQKGLQALSRFCKGQQKDLILFSGGNSQLTYHKDNFETLSINSKDFYSESLIDFMNRYVNDKVDNLLELIYGKKWILSYLMKQRQLSKILETEESPENKILIEDKINEIRKITGISGNDVDREINQTIAKI